jgi:hypothetical protein
LPLARLLPLTDQVVERGEQAAKRVVQRRRVRAALDGVHQFEKSGVLRREAYVGGRDGPQLRLVVVSGGLDRRAQLVAQAQEPGFSEGVQQGLAVGEVAARLTPAWSRPSSTRLR